MIDVSPNDKDDALKITAFPMKADGTTLAMLRNAAGDKGTIVRWNKNQLPCFSQWKHTTGLNEGYVTGLEPATNYPNQKVFERERGRVVTLQAGQTKL